jgi:hypothetical protein
LRLREMSAEESLATWEHAMEEAMILYVRAPLGAPSAFPQWQERRWAIFKNPMFFPCDTDTKPGTAAIQEGRVVSNASSYETKRLFGELVDQIETKGSNRWMMVD